MLRQSAGPYYPWLYECGEPTCPFAQQAVDNRWNDLQPGQAPPRTVNLGDCIGVDQRAFPRPVHVKVKLATLGIDSSLWGDLDEFSGTVLDRYYHEVHGQPMFTVDFGGSIGRREVRVHETRLDTLRQFGGKTQRTLQFEDTQPWESLLPQSHQQPSGSNEGGPSTVASGSAGTGPSTASPFSMWQPLSPTYNSDEDGDWEANFEDFNCGQGSGMNFSQESSDYSFEEDPLVELGIYNKDEDRSGWPFERKFADSEWQETEMTLLQDRENFTGLQPGPTAPPLPTELEYFRRFWTDHILDDIVKETNRYAEQPSELFPHLTNGRATWTPIDRAELLAWFGILILMGLKGFPNIRCYWDQRSFYTCPVISEVMTRKRFEAIIRCVHLVNNEAVVTDRTDPSYDKIAKVRWLVEAFVATSQSQYNNERECTVDEMMIPYKGRYCNIQQYMKAKPVQFGIKVWALANSQSRYISNVIIYLGAGEDRAEGETVSENAVLRAVQGLEGRGHFLVMDNYFTSPSLFLELMARGFWATGTVRKTRRGFPASLAGFKKTELPGRGELVVRMHRDRNMCALMWMDSKPVFLLTTACNPIDPNATAGR